MRTLGGRYDRNEALTAFAFLLPLMVGIVLFFIIPIGQAFFYSLIKWKGAGPMEFVGLDNFVKLFTNDRKFTGELRNTFAFVFGSVPFTIIIALITAALMNSVRKGVGVYRVIYFLPNVTMVAVVAMIWKWLLNSQYGIVDNILDFMFGIRPAWLGDPSLTMFSMCVIGIWSGMGYCIVILIAALQNVDKTYYEAATIDGANGFQQFRHITAPLVTPTIFFLLITRMIQAFNQFDLVYMLVPSGTYGPIHRSLATVVFGIYDSAFQNFAMGYACAKAVILFFIIMIVTFIQFLGEKRWVKY
jgi:multiple sugar transport system permease protein